MGINIDNNNTFGNYWEGFLESNDTFKRPKLKPVSIKFDPLVLQKIKMLTKKRSISYSAYVRYLLAKGIEHRFSQMVKST